MVRDAARLVGPEREGGGAAGARRGEAQLQRNLLIPDAAGRRLVAGRVGALIVKVWLPSASRTACWRRGSPRRRASTRTSVPPGVDRAPAQRPLPVRIHDHFAVVARERDRGRADVLELRDHRRGEVLRFTRGFDVEVARRPRDDDRASLPRPRNRRPPSRRTASRPMPRGRSGSPGTARSSGPGTPSIVQAVLAARDVARGRVVAGDMHVLTPPYPRERTVTSFAARASAPAPPSRIAIAASTSRAACLEVRLRCMLRTVRDGAFKRVSPVLQDRRTVRRFVLLGGVQRGLALGDREAPLVERLAEDHAARG